MQIFSGKSAINLNQACSPLPPFISAVQVYQNEWLCYKEYGAKLCLVHWKENAIGSVFILCLLEKPTVITWKMYFLRWSLSQKWNAPSRAFQMSNWIMHFPDILG